MGRRGRDARGSGADAWAPIDTESDQVEYTVAVERIGEVRERRGWSYERAVRPYGVRDHPARADVWPLRRFGRSFQVLLLSMTQRSCSTTRLRFVIGRERPLVVNPGTASSVRGMPHHLHVDAVLNADLAGTRSSVTGVDEQRLDARHPAPWSRPTASSSIASEGSGT